MSAPNDPKRFPLLDSLLEARRLKREPIYTVRATAAIFDVSTRTIEDWCCEGKMMPRDLPGHGRFLNEDLEEFLQRSQRKRKRHEHDSAKGEGGHANQDNDDDSEHRDGVAPRRRGR